MPASPLVYVIHPDPQIRESAHDIARRLHVHCTSFASPREFVDTNAHDVQACMLTYVPDGEESSAPATLQKPCDPASLAIVLATAAPHAARVVQPLPLAVEDRSAELHGRQLEETLRQGLQAAEQELRNRQRRQQAHDDRARIVARLARLTEGERAVLDQVLAGNLNKMIARSLDVSVRTIEQRRRNIMIKMEAGSLAQLVRQMTKLQLYDELLD